MRFRENLGGGQQDEVGSVEAGTGAKTDYRDDPG